MPRIGRRLGNLIGKSVEALLAPAPDPRLTYADAVQRQQILLGEVRRALRQMGDAKATLRARMDAAEATLAQFQDEARAFLVADREDLARLTLQRRHAIFLELQAVARQVTDVEREEQRLALTEQRLALQVDALLTRRDVIAARYDAAEAQVRVGEALAGVTGELGELDLAVGRAETETAHLKARATALESLIESGTLATPLSGADGVERELQAIATERAVDHDLATLKEALQLDSPPAAPTAGAARPRH